MPKITADMCRGWIQAVYAALPYYAAGIEMSVLIQMAVQSGLWGPPMSAAMDELLELEDVCDARGEYCYRVARLREASKNERKIQSTNMPAQ